VPQLAELYARLLEQLDLNDVTVIGNSVGGWITAEIALLRPPRVSRIVDPDYGRAYAAAIPTARFLLLASTGHAPQQETPDLVLQAISDTAEANHADGPVAHSR
jgi:pimeloyl-ACP methyl ester carboxylesterase